MVAVARTQLARSNTLNRKWFLDVNIGTVSVPNWIGVFGVTELKPDKATTLQDISDFEAGGWKSQVATALAWSITGKLRRAATNADAAAYDPGQEKLRLASDQTGVGNSVHIRWYEMEPGGPRVEAYEGFAAVGWNPDGGNMEAPDMVSLTLTGQGSRTVITHPDTTAAPVPTITAVTPAGQSVGEIVTITGTGFVGTTAVSIDSLSADFVVVSAAVIHAVVPTGAAGAAPTTVTTPGGTSAPFAYTVV